MRIKRSTREPRGRRDVVDVRLKNISRKSRNFGIAFVPARGRLAKIYNRTILPRVFRRLAVDRGHRIPIRERFGTELEMRRHVNNGPARVNGRPLSGRSAQWTNTVRKQRLCRIGEVGSNAIRSGRACERRDCFPAPFSLRELKTVPPIDGFCSLSQVVRLGDLDLDPEIEDGATPLDVPIERVVAHSRYLYDNKLVNDIAVLTLTESVTFTGENARLVLRFRVDHSGTIQRYGDRHCHQIHA